MTHELEVADLDGVTRIRAAFKAGDDAALSAETVGFLTLGFVAGKNPDDRVVYASM